MPRVSGDGARATIFLADDLLRADIGRATQSVPRCRGAAVPELLSLQRQTLGILQQSLAIQRSTERHAASLDRKTGGTAPVAAPAPAPLP